MDLRKDLAAPVVAALHTGLVVHDSHVLLRTVSGIVSVIERFNINRQNHFVR
jgi:hypothetical protein